MPRIRTIKPDFWKSETIATLPIPARLTFVGLWTYVDDNGVGVDNHKLIAAELYGLEDDPREARDMTRECLASLAEAGVIVRYTVGRKRYLRVTSWDEHQRIDRLNKPRYPLPDDADAHILTPAQAAEIDQPPAPVPDLSPNPRATLATVHRLEQRNRGTEEQRNNTHTLTAEPPQPDVPASPDADATAREPEPRTRISRRACDDTFDRFWSVYPRRIGKGAARRAWDKLARNPAVDLETVIASAARYRDDGPRQRADIRYTPHPATWLNGHRWLDELPQPGNALTLVDAGPTRPSTTDQRVRDALALAARLDAWADS